MGAWQRRAQHMVGSVAELPQPVGAVEYAGVFRETAEHNIYLFDQEMARIGVRYFAEFRGRRYRTTRFTIFVPTEQVGAVAAIAARLFRV
ncbi:hypothetical protein GobsT_46940 [Gemmata obscuriglobus]|uniref:Uncharacterized protein n=1 Tax=Gemmata obscuriglobus TaxID=114 RepID=A0A2Z3HBP5_9BACT|nr:hypothetical protein [Gemmata obscuriglobus]AWM37344.1 hypothetical protein C1280_10140 [Gemmata obscuriglobus]AWM40395.1 hypothetical protein C1280_27685 [Gemmata obscuriglobus]QEG26371.1 hypothetical protein GobsT_11100 [Gemmata obscuriglobus]QEG29895.1 hypothetical protein GobsT_46940 [Gemmata obscuriglobus]